MATFLRGNKMVKEETRRIVPSRVKLSRTKKKSTKQAAASSTDCDCCQIGHDGFAFCYDGGLIILDDFPATGGPWTPAVQPNGQVVWVNQGAADATDPR